MSESRITSSAKESGSASTEDDNDQVSPPHPKPSDPCEDVLGVDVVTAGIESLQVQESPSRNQNETTAKQKPPPRTSKKKTKTPREKSIPQVIQRFAGWIQTGEVKQLLVVSGAGVSVAAGIPDFRTPGTGIYDNLQAYNLPFAEAVFDVHFFRKNPYPFWSLAMELWPQQSKQEQEQHQQQRKHLPTLTHSFLALLERKKLLLRNYTQNIDGLEVAAGLSEDLLVECHGHFRTASCIDCKHKISEKEFQALYANLLIEVERDENGKLCPPETGAKLGNKKDNKKNKEDIQKRREKMMKPPRCPRCKNGLIKPDIVFFGEGLPARFHHLLPTDCRKADCCLVLGTSLTVAPVSHIPEMVHCEKRVLLNRECVGNFQAHRQQTKNDPNYLFQAGDCDDSVRLLARALDWEDELDALHQEAHSKLLAEK